MFRKQASSFHASNNNNAHNNKSGPRFILKNPSGPRNSSVLESHEDLRDCHSYLELYQKSKQDSSPDIYEDYLRKQHSGFNNIHGNSFHQNNSNASNSYLKNPQQYGQNNESNQPPSNQHMKLQQILQKQINNSKSNINTSKSKLNKSKNTSFEIIRNNVFNPKPKSMETLEVNRSQVRHKTIMDGDELSVLREENRKLVGSIKRLNVDLQTMKSQHLASVNESERMRDQLNEQNSSLNKVLDMMHSEKQSFIQQLQGRDYTISQLRRTIQDLNEQLTTPNRNTHQEIDQLKTRILARKSNQRSSRENISIDSRATVSKNDEILNSMDSSARIDIQNLYEDKENYINVSNFQKRKK